MDKTDMEKIVKLAKALKKDTQDIYSDLSDYGDLLSSEEEDLPIVKLMNRLEKHTSNLYSLVSKLKKTL